jgi:hypothetical protein
MVQKSMVTVLGVMLALVMCVGLSGNIAMAQCPDVGCRDDDEFTTEFRLQDCSFTPSGKNAYFDLTPGYQLLLQGCDEEECIRLLITVLNETQDISFYDNNGTLLNVKTRVVEEREWVGDTLEELELLEISRNFFARCKETDAIYYLGEDVLIFDECDFCDFWDSTCEPSNEGEWRAGDLILEECHDDFEQDYNLPGLIMPATFLLGAKYFQELAPGVARDRAEHTAMGLEWPPEDPIFTGCVEVSETNSVEGACKEKDADIKIYCPEVGLVQDAEAVLVEYGYRLDGWWPPPDPDCDGDDNGE